MPSSTVHDVADLVGSVRAGLRARSAGTDAGTDAGTAVSRAAWLERTVVRPLVSAGLLADAPAGPPAAARIDPDAGLGELAVALAEAAADDPRPALLEACAGALRLLVATGGPHTDRLTDALARIPGDPTGRVTVAPDGPYLVQGPAAARLVTWLGEPVAAPALVALCRCGASAARPWCDGSHADIGFSGQKRPDRVPDRLDRYDARQFEITDNRGLCAHSGRCTDALPVAFRVHAEPFVAPAGARADDLLRAVQACPSGALGLALERRRAAALADRDREPGVEISRDGPYRLTGGVAVRDGDGVEVPRPAGSSPEHASLCRCGHSTNKPFCSGAHWNADFHDPVADPDAEPTLFAWAGGYPALLRTTTLFYERHVAADDLLAPLFARMEPDHPERVAAWLSEVFGGPEFYSQRYGGYARMISQHIGKNLTETQRARWISLLARSADEAGLPADPEFRAAFTAYLEWGTRIAVENSADDARPPDGMPIPRWWWVCNATPAARPSSLPGSAPDQEQPVEEPGTDDPVEFTRHVRGLFRPRDRGSMRFVFDLWSHEDVTTHAEAILGRLRDGSMPCDGPWPPDRIEVFARWVRDGTLP